MSLTVSSFGANAPSSDGTEASSSSAIGYLPGKVGSTFGKGLCGCVHARPNLMAIKQRMGAPQPARAAPRPMVMPYLTEVSRDAATAASIYGVLPASRPVSTVTTHSTALRSQEVKPTTLARPRVPQPAMGALQRAIASENVSVAARAIPDMSGLTAFCLCPCGRRTRG